MAFKNQAILSTLIISISLVWISEAGSPEKPFDCYYCDILAYSYLHDVRELQTCEFEDYIEINNQRSKYHLTYDKYDQELHKKLGNYKFCEKFRGYDEFGNFEIVRRCYDRLLNCTGFFHVNSEWKKVPLSPFLVCQSDTNECVNDSNIRSDSSTGGIGTVYIWISFLLGSCIFSTFNV